jgi:glycerophosphoryl diester phosphodiesterase
MMKRKDIIFYAVVKILFTLVIFPAVFLCFAAEKNSSPVKAEQQTGRIYVVGYRGGAGLAPENTLSAFKKACEIGVDAIELDVLLTVDGNIVVHHDYTLKPEIARTADGEWLSRSGPAIKDLTLAQLKTYDIDEFQGSIPHPQAVKAAGGLYWAPFYKHLTYDLLQEAHRLGLKVFVWAVDSHSEMVRLMEMGVDGVITNRPDILKAVVGLP